MPGNLDMLMSHRIKNVLFSVALMYSRNFKHHRKRLFHYQHSIPKTPAATIIGRLGHRQQR